MEYILYCDEGSDQGEYYRFYGGALVRSIHFDAVNDRLKKYKESNNISSEMKWNNVSPLMLSLYMGLIDEFFSFVEEDKVKVRIMFQRKSISVPRLVGLTKEQKENAYFLLYYQFIKHAFGFKYSNPDNFEKIKLKLFLDRLPNNQEKLERFKKYIYGLQNTPEFMAAKISIDYEDIADVDSKQHNILQCIDIITGAMWFRLNKLHQVKPEGQRTRGKKTIAKEKMYEHIYSHVSRLKPNFNIGITTGVSGDYSNYWKHPFRHWLFIPNQT